MVNTLCIIVVHIICHKLGGINKKKNQNVMSKPFSSSKYLKFFAYIWNCFMGAMLMYTYFIVSVKKSLRL